MRFGRFRHGYVYRVVKDGKTVYKAKSATYDKDGIPIEYRVRPASGAVRLYVNDELIGVQTPLGTEG